MGIATESGVQEAGEVDRRIGLEPGSEGAYPIEDRFRSLPLHGQVPNDLRGPLGIDDISLVVDVEEHCPGLPPDPVSKVGRRGPGSSVQPLMQLVWREAALGNVPKDVTGKVGLRGVEDRDSQAVLIKGKGAEGQKEQLAERHIQRVKARVVPGVAHKWDTADNLLILGG